jgi:hypothetical protein
MGNTRPAIESYEINSSDREIHAIAVMLEALARHVDRSKDSPNCEENIEHGRKAMIRCARYVLARVEAA